jgi:hypothetical protein
MKKAEEIKQAVAEYFNSVLEEYYTPDKIEVTKRSDGKTKLTVEREYYRPDPTAETYRLREGVQPCTLLEFLLAIKEATGAKFIDVGEKTSKHGCLTCDFGSAYGWVFVLWD